LYFYYAAPVSQEVHADGTPEWAKRIPKPGLLPIDYVVPDSLPPGFTMDGRVWLSPNREDGSITIIWSMGRADGGQGELRVWYAPGDDRVGRVQLSLPDGLKAKDLSTFAWSRFLAIADAARRRNEAGMDMPPISMDRELSDLVEVAMGRKRSRRVIPGSRPGRRGHPDEHYEEIAARYTAMVLQGERYPTKRLSEHYHVSRSTAAGWVRGARERGLLERARPGRAG
jgi:hypothetical protein